MHIVNVICILFRNAYVYVHVHLYCCYLYMYMSIYILSGHIYVSTLLTRAKCCTRLSLCWKILNISDSTETFCIVILDYGLKTSQPFNSYPCHASEVTRNTLNHCLKFTVRSIFCHICYGKISEKNFNTFFKVKLFVSKTSDSCFQGFDLFQMLLASHS